MHREPAIGKPLPLVKGIHPIRREVALVGGGHAHVEVLRRFAMRPLQGVRLTVISPQYRTPYSGMLPGTVAGRYSLAESHIDLLPLCHAAGAQFYRGRAVGLDLEKRRVLCDGRPPAGFEILSLDVGSASPVDLVPGARRHAIPVKPVDRFLERLERLGEELPDQARVVVVGGGAGGFELVLALRKRLGARRRCILCSASASILPTHGRWARSRGRRFLREAGVEVREGFQAAEVEEGLLIGVRGERLEHDALFWATGAAPPDWPGRSGLQTDGRGFVAVDSTLRSLSHPFVFAAGDMAMVEGRPLARAGVHAVRQGPPLAVNIRRVLRGERLRRYRPQRRFLSLLGLSDGRALASRGSLCLWGRGVWRAKEWIDRRWMRRYQDLGAMKPRPDRALEAPEIRCAGCGSKVGQDVLEEILERLGLSGQGPEDAAVLPPLPEGAWVQSVDFLPSFLPDPYLFGRIAVLHALCDVLAMGARIHSVQATAMVPWGGSLSCRESLFQLLSGTAEEVRRHGADLAGGHSLEGERFSLGLVVNGTLEGERPWRKGGLREGDRLILTKGLGTGALLAALMRGRCPSSWLEPAIASMLLSHAPLAPLLRRVGARAATDCTGFGLAGHLGEMLRASGTDAQLELEAVPALPGALECLDRGLRSSLHDRNRRASQGMLLGEGRESPRLPLIFDPQTSGGLLLAVEGKRAEQALRRIRREGWDRAAIVGTVLPRQGGSPRAFLR